MGVLLNLVLLVIISTSEAINTHQRIKRRAGEISLLKITCTGNPKFVKDVYCRSYKSSRGFANVTVHGTLLESQPKLFGRVQAWQKMNSNRYMPFLNTIDFDVCAFTNSLNSTKPHIITTLLEQIKPNFREYLKDIIHPCPYEGLIRLSTVLSKIQSAVIMNVLPVADFKLIVTFFTGAHEEIFATSIFFSSK